MPLHVCQTALKTFFGREFRVRMLFFACLGAALGFSAGVRAATGSGPNILWICSDDHAAYVTGAYGNPQVHTPNLDRLASEGMRFDNAFANSPVCTASRAAFITGRYPRTVGVTLLNTPLPEKEATLADLLKAAGYETAAIGKTHFNSELKHGYDQLIDVAQYQAWLKNKQVTPIAPDTKVKPAFKPFKDPASVWLNSQVLPNATVDADSLGTFLAQESAGFIKQKRAHPFFLFVGFHEPHSPFDFPVEYAGRHKPGEFTVPKPGRGDDWQIPKIFRSLTDSEKQGIIAAYYTSVEFLDKNVGLVLDALAQSGQADNTLVIYLGDHGYMLGQHGRFEKHCGFDQAIRAPLFLRYPKEIKPRQNTAALVEFIDILPTVLEYCGVKISANVQGQSLVPLLAGKADKIHDTVYINYSENEEAYLRTAHWKFIYGTGERVREDGYETENPLPGKTVILYDLDKDPDEMENLAKRPQYKRVVDGFTYQLTEHLRSTSRNPGWVPKKENLEEVLEYCLQPDDYNPNPPKPKSAFPAAKDKAAPAR